MLHTLRNRFRSYLRDEDGVILAETLIILPLLIWVLVAIFVYWDVWKTVNTSQKAAYSIADLLSRQEDPVPPSFIDNMDSVLAFLTPNAPVAAMRITSLEYDLTDDKYCLLFSRTNDPTDAPALTESEIQAWSVDQMPTLTDRESVFVVETWVRFEPRFNTGILNFGQMLAGMTFGEFIVTRPRHRRLVLENNMNCL